MKQKLSNRHKYLCKISHSKSQQHTIRKLIIYKHEWSKVDVFSLRSAFYVFYFEAGSPKNKRCASASQLFLLCQHFFLLPHIPQRRRTRASYQSVTRRLSRGAGASRVSSKFPENSATSAAAAAPNVERGSSRGKIVEIRFQWWIVSGCWRCSEGRDLFVSQKGRWMFWMSDGRSLNIECCEAE